MGKFNGKDATVWMRSIRPHTYENKPQDVGAIYLAHEEMVETIEILKMAVRESAPPRAVRSPEPETPTPPVDQPEPPRALGRLRGGRPRSDA
jgi:hypothetical protein